jgi:hypothetical protein
MKHTINATLRCNDGIAPNEDEVDLMIKTLEMRIGTEFIAERIYWGPIMWQDRDFIFAIYRDWNKAE